MNEILFPLIAASPDVRTYLGTDPARFYEFGTAPKGDQERVPYATWQVITGTPDNLLDQAPDCDFVTVQIDVWATVAGTTRAAAAAIRRSLEDHAYVTAWRTLPQDAETGQFRFSLDASFIIDN